MTNKRMVFLAVAFQILTLAVAGVSRGQKTFGSSKDPVGNNKVEIPREPGWRDPSYRGWEVLSIPGLISTYYDLDQDGNLDYMVIRKILRKASSEEVVMEQAVDIARRDKLSVYFSNPVVYFTNRNPLFYCLGVDFRRNCRDIWVDIAEDGLNGNEELYTLSTPLPNVR